MMCPNQDLVILEFIKQNLHQPSPSLTLVEHFKGHESIIQKEANYEHSYDEIVKFDEESYSDVDIKLEIDPIA